MLGRAERDPGHERGDQSVADRCVGEAVGGEPESDREDALVARGDAARRGEAMNPAAGDPQRGADHRSGGRLAEDLDALRSRVATRRREDQEEEHERQRQTVVQARFEVERVAHPLGHALGGDDRRRDDRIGRGQDGGQKKRLGDRELGEEDEADHREERQRDRHREDDRPRRRPPVHAQELALDDQAVGEQGQDQRQLDQVDDVRVRDVHRDHVGEGEGDAQADREDRDREHGPVHDARQPSRHRQQQAEEKERFAEPEVHQDRLCGKWRREPKGCLTPLRKWRPPGPARGRARPGARRPGPRWSRRPCAGCRRRSTC